VLETAGGWELAVAGPAFCFCRKGCSDLLPGRSGCLLSLEHLYWGGRGESEVQSSGLGGRAAFSQIPGKVRTSCYVFSVSRNAILSKQQCYVFNRIPCFLQRAIFFLLPRGGGFVLSSSPLSTETWTQSSPCPTWAKQQQP